MSRFSNLHRIGWLGRISNPSGDSQARFPKKTRRKCAKPLLNFEQLEDRKLLADLSGTNLNDAFVLSYSLQAGTVEVSISTNGGAATSLGTFWWAEPINLNGLAGQDSVEIRLVNAVGYSTMIDSSGIKINSGGTLTRSNTESLKFVGSFHDDKYRFDADTPLGSISIDESAGDPETIWGDTLDFSATSSAVNVNLGFASNQAVNGNLTLNLMSSTTFEIAIGGDGNDSLAGNSRNNRLIGNAGNDTLTGISGRDTLDGGAGNDGLVGGTGEDDYIFALASAAEADVLTETSTETPVGFGDTLRFPDMPIPVSLNLGSAAIQNVHTNRTLQLNSATTFESVFGGSGNDFLTGNSLRNYLYGQAGHDILVGGAANDILDGGTGRDILIGGLGIDTLNGGTGDDILIGGTTSSSRTLDLNAVRNKWTARGSYEERVASIKSGPTNESLIANVNVFDDGTLDYLTGGDDRDWFFGNLLGDQSDRGGDETWENLI